MDNQPNDFQNFLNHKFSDVLDDYARFVTQKEEQVKTRTNKEEEFITQFLDIRSKFIWPVFSALKAEAEKICGKPSRPQYEDEVVAVIKWVDGTIIDSVWKIKS